MTEGRGDEGSRGRRNVSSGSPFEQLIGFSRAVRVGDRVLVAGTAPVWPDGSCDPDAGKQTERCLQIIDTALTEAGASLDDVVRTRLFLVDAGDADAVGRAHAQVFGAVRPVATMVVVAALLDGRWRVEIEAEAVVSQAVVSQAVVSQAVVSEAVVSPPEASGR